MLYYSYMCVTSCSCEDYVIYNLAKCIIWSACIGDCWLQSLTLAFMCYIMVVSISMNIEIENVPNKSSVQLDFLLWCSSSLFYQKTNSTTYSVSINNHILDMKTYPSHLTIKSFFSFFPLQCQEQLYHDHFLFSFYLITFSTFIQQAMSELPFGLYVKTSRGAKPFILLPPTRWLTAHRSLWLCLGLVENVSNVLLHHLLLVARHYIYTCKLKNSIPKLQVYIQLLLTSMKIEKKIAQENCTLNYFERKWNPLKDALQY